MTLTVCFVLAITNETWDLSPEMSNVKGGTELIRTVVD